MLKLSEIQRKSFDEHALEKGFLNGEDLNHWITITSDITYGCAVVFGLETKLDFLYQSNRDEYENIIKNCIDYKNCEHKINGKCCLIKLLKNE